MDRTGYNYFAGADTNQSRLGFMTPGTRSVFTTFEAERGNPFVERMVNTSGSLLMMSNHLEPGSSRPVSKNVGAAQAYGDRSTFQELPYGNFGVREHGKVGVFYQPGGHNVWYGSTGNATNSGINSNQLNNYMAGDDPRVFAEFERSLASIHRGQVPASGKYLFWTGPHGDNKAASELLSIIGNKNDHNALYFATPTLSDPQLIQTILGKAHQGDQVYIGLGGITPNDRNFNQEAYKAFTAAGLPNLHVSWHNGPEHFNLISQGNIAGGGSMRGSKGATHGRSTESYLILRDNAQMAMVNRQSIASAHNFPQTPGHPLTDMAGSGGKAVPGAYDRYGRFMYAFTPAWRLPGAAKDWQMMIDTNEIFDHETFRQAQYIATTQGGYRTYQNHFFKHIYLEEKAWKLKGREIDPNTPIPKAVSDMDQAMQAPTRMELWQGEARLMFGKDSKVVQLLEQRGNRGPLGTVLVNMGRLADKTIFARTYSRFMTSGIYRDREPSEEDGGFFSGASEWFANNLTNIGMGIATFHVGQLLAESWGKSLSGAGQFISEMNELAQLHESNVLGSGNTGPGRYMAWGAARAMNVVAQTRNLAFIFQAELVRQVNAQTGKVAEAVSGDVGLNHKLALDQILAKDQYFNIEIHNTQADAIAAKIVRTRLASSSGSVYQIAGGKWALEYSSNLTPMTFKNRQHLMSQHMRTYATGLGGGVGGFLDLVAPTVGDDAVLARKERWAAAKALLKGDLEAFTMHSMRAGEAYERSRSMARVYGEYGGGPSRAARTGIIGTLVAFGVGDYLVGQLTTSRPATLKMQVDNIADIVRAKVDDPKNQISYLGFNYGNPFRQGRDVLTAVPGTYASAAYAAGWVAQFHVSMFREAPTETMAVYAGAMVSSMVAYGGMSRKLDGLGAAYNDRLYHNRPQPLGRAIAYRGRNIWAKAAGMLVGAGVLAGGAISLQNQVVKSLNYASQILRTPSQAGQASAVAMHYQAHWDGQWTPISVFNAIADLIGANAKNTMQGLKALDEKFTWRTPGKRTATAMAQDEANREAGKNLTEAQRNFMLDLSENYGTAKEESEITTSGTLVARVGDLRNFGMDLVALTSGSKTTFMLSVIAPMPMSFMAGTKLPFYYDSHRSRQFDKWFASDKPDPQWFDQILSHGLVKTGGKNGWLANSTRKLLNWGYEGGSPWENLVRVQTQLYSVAMGFATDPTISTVGMGLLFGGSAYGSYKASGGAARGTMTQRFTRWWETGADAEMSWDPMRNVGNMAFHRGGPIGGPIRLLSRIAASVTTLFTDMPGRMVSLVGMTRDVGAHTAARMAQEHLGRTDAHWAHWETLNYREGTIGKISRASKLAGRGATIGMMAYIGYEWAKANNRDSMERGGFKEQVAIGYNQLKNTGIPFVSKIAANFYSRIMDIADDTHRPKWAVTRFQLTPQGTLEGVEMNPIVGQIQPGWGGWRESLWAGLGRLTHNVSAEGAQTGMIATGQTGNDLYMTIVNDEIKWNAPAVRIDALMGNSAFKANVTMHPVHKGKGDTGEDYELAMAMGGSMAQISGRFMGRKRPAFMGKMFLNPGMRGSSGVYDADPIIKLALQQRFAVSQAALAAYPSQMFYYFGDYDKGRLTGPKHGRYNKIETWTPGQKIKNTSFITYSMQSVYSDGNTMSQFTWGIHNISVAANRLTIQRVFKGAVAAGSEMYSQLGLEKYAGGKLLGNIVQAGTGVVDGHSDVERLQALVSSFNQMYDRGYSSPVMEDNDAAFMSAPDQDQPELLKLPVAAHSPVDFTMGWMNYSSSRTSLAVWALVAGAPGLAMVGAGVHSLIKRFGGGDDDFKKHLNRRKRERYGRTRGTFTRPVRGSATMWSMSHQGVGLAELDLPIGGDTHNQRSIRFGDHMARPFTDLLDHTGAVSVSAEQKANFYRKIWHNIGHIYEGLESTSSSYKLVRSVEMLDEELLKLDMGAHGATPPPGWQRSAVLDRLRADLNQLHGDLVATHAAHGAPHDVIRVASNGSMHPNVFMRRFEQITQDALYRFDQAANLRQVAFEPLRRQTGLRGLLGGIQAVKTWSLIDDPNYMPPPMTRGTPPYGSPLIDFAQRNDLGPGMGRVREGYRGVGFKGIWQGARDVVGVGAKALNLMFTPVTWLTNMLMGFGVTTGLLATAIDEKDPIYGGKTRKNAIAFGEDTATSLTEMLAIQTVGVTAAALAAPVVAVGGVIGALGTGIAIAGGSLAMMGPMIWAKNANTLRPDMRQDYYKRGKGLHLKTWKDAAYLSDRFISRTAQMLFDATAKAVKGRKDWSNSAKIVFGAGMQTNADASYILRQWAYNASKKTTHDMGTQIEKSLAKFVSDNFDAITPLGHVLGYAIDMTNTSFSLSATWSSESPIWWGPNSALEHPVGGRMDWVHDAWTAVEKPKQLHMMMSADPLGSSMYELVAPETLGMESGSNSNLMNLNFRAQYEMKGDGTGGFGNASAGRAFRFRPIRVVDSIIGGELQRRAIMHEMAVIGGGMSALMYDSWGAYETHRGKRWIDNGTSVGPNGSVGPQGPGPASAGWFKDLTKSDLPVLHQAIESATGILRGYRGPSGVEASALPFVKKWAAYYHVPEGAVKAMIMVETGGTGRNFPHPNASGAIGYMQIVPGPGGSWHPLHPELGDKNYADPSTNIRLGTEYIRNNYDQIKKASIKAGYKLDDTTLWTMAAAAHQTGLSQANTIDYFKRGQFAPMSDSNMSNEAYGQRWLNFYKSGGKTPEIEEGLSALPPAERERARKDLMLGAKYFFSGSGGSVDKLVDNSLIWVSQDKREQVKEAIRTSLFEQKYWLSHDKPTAWSRRAPGTLGLYPSDKQRAYLWYQAIKTVQGGETDNLSSNKTLRITASHGIRHMTADMVKAAKNFQSIFGGTLSGGWRTEEENIAWGGVPGSKHMQGLAFDMVGVPGEGTPAATKIHAWALRHKLYALYHDAGSGFHWHFQSNTGIVPNLDPSPADLAMISYLEKEITKSRPAGVKTLAFGSKGLGPLAPGPLWPINYDDILNRSPKYNKFSPKKRKEALALLEKLLPDYGMTNVLDPRGISGDPTTRPKPTVDLPADNDDKDDSNYWYDFGLTVLGGLAIGGAAYTLHRWNAAGKKAIRTGGGGWYNKRPSGPSGPLGPNGPRPGPRPRPPAPVPGTGVLYGTFWTIAHFNRFTTAVGRVLRAPGNFIKAQNWNRRSPGNFIHETLWNLGEAFRGLGRGLTQLRYHGFRFEQGMRSWVQHKRQNWDYTVMWQEHDRKILFTNKNFQDPILDWHHPNWSFRAGWVANLASSARATRQNFYQSLFDIAAHGVYGTVRAVAGAINGVAQGRENLRAANAWDRGALRDARRAISNWWRPQIHPLENHPWTDKGPHMGPEEASPYITSRRPAHVGSGGYNTRLNPNAWQRMVRKFKADWVWDKKAERFRPEGLGSRFYRNAGAALRATGRGYSSAVDTVLFHVSEEARYRFGVIWDFTKNHFKHRFTYGIGFIHDGILKDAYNLYNRMRTRNTTYIDPIQEEYQRTQSQVQNKPLRSSQLGAQGSHQFSGDPNIQNFGIETTTGNAGYGDPSITGGPSIPGVPGLWVQTPHDEQWSDPSTSWNNIAGMRRASRRQRVTMATLRPRTRLLPYSIHHSPQANIDATITNMNDIMLEAEAFGRYLMELAWAPRSGRSGVEPEISRHITERPMLLLAETTGVSSSLSPAKPLPRGAHSGFIINPLEVMYQLGRLAVRGLLKAYTAFTGLFATRVLDNISGVAAPRRYTVDGVFHSGPTTPYNSFSYRHEHIRWTTNQPFFPSVITDPDHYHLHYNRDVYQNKSKLYWSPVRGRTGREPGLVPRADMLEALVAAEAHDLAHGYGPELSPTLIRGTNSPAARAQRAMQKFPALRARNPRHYTVSGVYRPSQGWISNQDWHTLHENNSRIVRRITGTRGDYARIAVREVEYETHPEEYNVEGPNYDEYGYHQDHQAPSNITRSRLYVFPRRTKIRSRQLWGSDLVFAGPIANREIRPGQFPGIRFGPSGGDDFYPGVHNPEHMGPVLSMAAVHKLLKDDRPGLAAEAMAQIKHRFNHLVANLGGPAEALQSLIYAPDSGRNYTKLLTDGRAMVNIDVEMQLPRLYESVLDGGTRRVRAVMGHELGHVLDYMIGAGAPISGSQEARNQREIRAWDLAARHLGIRSPKDRAYALSQYSIQETTHRKAGRHWVTSDPFGFGLTGTLFTRRGGRAPTPGAGVARFLPPGFGRPGMPTGGDDFYPGVPADPHHEHVQSLVELMRALPIGKELSIWDWKRSVLGAERKELHEEIEEIWKRERLNDGWIKTWTLPSRIEPHIPAIWNKAIDLANEIVPKDLTFDYLEKMVHDFELNNKKHIDSMIQLRGSDFNSRIGAVTVKGEIRRHENELLSDSIVVKYKIGKDITPADQHYAAVNNGRDQIMAFFRKRDHSYWSEPKRDGKFTASNRRISQALDVYDDMISQGRDPNEAYSLAIDHEFSKRSNMGYDAKTLRKNLAVDYDKKDFGLITGMFRSYKNLPKAEIKRRQDIFDQMIAQGEPPTLAARAARGESIAPANPLLTLPESLGDETQQREAAVAEWMKRSGLKSVREHLRPSSIFALTGRSYTRGVGSSVFIPVSMGHDRVRPGMFSAVIRFGPSGGDDWVPMPEAMASGRRYVRGTQNYRLPLVMTLEAQVARHRSDAIIFDRRAARRWPAAVGWLKTHGPLMTQALLGSGVNSAATRYGHARGMESQGVGGWFDRPNQQIILNAQAFNAINAVATGRSLAGVIRSKEGFSFWLHELMHAANFTSATHKDMAYSPRHLAMEEGLTDSLMHGHLDRAFELLGHAQNPYLGIHAVGVNIAYPHHMAAVTAFGILAGHETKASRLDFFRNLKLNVEPLDRPYAVIDQILAHNRITQRGGHLELVTADGRKHHSNYYNAWTATENAVNYGLDAQYEDIFAGIPMNGLMNQFRPQLERYQAVQARLLNSIQAGRVTRRLSEPIRYMPLQSEINFILVGQGRLNRYGEADFRDQVDELRFYREFGEAVDAHERAETARYDSFTGSMFYSDGSPFNFADRTKAFRENPFRQIAGEGPVISETEARNQIQSGRLKPWEALKSGHFQHFISNMISQHLGEYFINKIQWELKGIFEANGLPSIEWTDFKKEDKDPEGSSLERNIKLNNRMKGGPLSHLLNVFAHEFQHFTDSQGSARTANLKGMPKIALMGQYHIYYNEYHSKYMDAGREVHDVEDWAIPTETNAWPLGFAFSKYYFHPKNIVKNLFRTLTSDTLKLEDNAQTNHKKFIDKLMRERVVGDSTKYTLSQERNPHERWYLNEDLGPLLDEPPDYDEHTGRTRMAATGVSARIKYGTTRRVFTSLGAQLIGRIVMHDVARMLGIRHTSMPAFKIIWNPNKIEKAEYDSINNQIKVNLAQANNLTDFVESVAHETVHRGSELGSSHTVRMHEKTDYFAEAYHETYGPESLYPEQAAKAFPNHSDSQNEYLHEEMTAQYFGKAYSRTGWLRRFFGIGRRLFMRDHLSRQGQDSWTERTKTNYEGKHYQYATNTRGEFVTPFNTNPTVLNLNADIFSTNQMVRYETNHILITGEVYDNTFHTSWVDKGRSSGKGLYRSALLRLFKRLEEGYGIKINQQNGESLVAGRASKLKQWGDRARVEEQVGPESWQTAIDLNPRSQMPIGLDPAVQAEVTALYQIAEQARINNARRAGQLDEMYTMRSLPAEDMLAGLDDMFSRTASTPQQRALDALEAGRVTRGGGLRLRAGQDTLGDLVPSGTIPTVDAEFVGYEHTAIVPLNSNRSSEGPTIDVSATAVRQKSIWQNRLSRVRDFFKRGENLRNGLFVVNHVLNTGLMALSLGSDLYTLATSNNMEEQNQAAMGLVQVGGFASLQYGAMLATARNIPYLATSLGIIGNVFGVAIGLNQVREANKLMQKAHGQDSLYYRATLGLITGRMMTVGGAMGFLGPVGAALGGVLALSSMAISSVGTVFINQSDASTSRYTNLASLAQNQSLQLNQLGLALPQIRRELRTVVRREVNKDFESLQVSILPSQMRTATARDRRRYIAEGMKQLAPQIEKEAIREKQIAEAQVKRQYQENKHRIDPSQPRPVPYALPEEIKVPDLPDMGIRGPGGSTPHLPKSAKTVIVESPKPVVKQASVDTQKPAGPTGKIPHMVGTGADGTPILKPVRFPKAPVDTKPRKISGGRNGQIDSAGYR